MSLTILWNLLSLLISNILLGIASSPNNKKIPFHCHLLVCFFLFYVWRKTLCPLTINCFVRRATSWLSIKPKYPLLTPLLSGDSLPCYSFTHLLYFHVTGGSSQFYHIPLSARHKVHIP